VSADQHPPSTGDGVYPQAGAPTPRRSRSAERAAEPSEAFDASRVQPSGDSARQQPAQGPQGAYGASKGGAFERGAVGGSHPERGAARGSATERGPWKRGAAEGGAAEGRAAEGRAAEGRAAEGGAFKSGAARGGASQRGTSERDAARGDASMGGASMGGASMGGASAGGASAGGASTGSASEGGESDLAGPDLARAVLDAALAKRREAARAPRRRSGGEESGRRLRGYSGPGPDPRDPQKFGAVLERLMKARGWEKPKAEATVFGAWERVVGPDIAKHSRPVKLDAGVLTVEAESTAWATQLRLLAGTLLKNIASEVGHNVVTRLQIHGPAAPSWSRGPRRVQGRGPRDTYG